MSFLWFHRFCLITLNIISTHMTQILYTSQLGSRKQAGACLIRRTSHDRFPVCDASSPERLSQTHWSLLTSSVRLSSSHSNDATSLTCAHCLFSPSNLFDFKAYCSIGLLCCSSYCLGCTDWKALVLTIAVYVRCKLPQSLGGGGVYFVAQWVTTLLQTSRREGGWLYNEFGILKSPT